jgi:agmatinase
VKNNLSGHNGFKTIIVSRMEALFRSALQPFLDSTTTYGDARYIVMGAPMDLTATYRSGTRFAPDAIRLASKYMETYSLRTSLNIEDISLADVGNIINLEEVESSMQRIEEAVRLTRRSGKMPVILGGEHTVTLGALRAMDPDLVVDFDAHLDLRDQLLGLKLSHATFMRRALEELDFRLIVLGCRAFSKEEFVFANENKDRVTVITTANLLNEGMEAELNTVKGWFDTASSIYLSIDMDVIDPVSAPAVGNPSPEGIDVTQLLDIISRIADKRYIGFDLTEVTPHYDSGLTVTQAAYITLETIYCLESSLRGS